MDYKYIKQLLDRYWKCETFLEEEEILRAFFSQKNIPSDMIEYRDLFVFAQQEYNNNNFLGDDFDEKILAIIEEPAPVKARPITITQRLMPLFKAAAIVAIILTLGNAMQVPFNSMSTVHENISEYDKAQHGASVAMSDSAVVDTMHHSSIEPSEAASTAILK